MLPGSKQADSRKIWCVLMETSVSTPDTIGSYVQRQQQIPGTLFSVDQSLMLVWPQVVALFALTVACFAAAYVLFMRQEVRA